MYERIDYDSSDEEYDSDVEYDSEAEGEDEFQWEEEVQKPPSYGTLEEEKARV